MVIYENAAHGFRKAGLFPLTTHGIGDIKLGPSKMVSVDDESGKKGAEADTTETKRTKVESNNIQDEPTSQVIEVQEPFTSKSADSTTKLMI